MIDRETLHARQMRRAAPKKLRVRHLPARANPRSSPFGLAWRAATEQNRLWKPASGESRANVILCTRSEGTVNSAEDAILSLDTSIFAAISSETTKDDRHSLLVLQNCARDAGHYAYLEIGSYVGGTLQPFYADHLCRQIYSIDKRPDVVPDERGRQWYHYDRQVNSTDTMMANLAKAFPSADAQKVVSFDSGVEEVDVTLITDQPRLCFIDAEHTNRAVFDDFSFCLRVAEPDAIVAFHDAGIVFGGLQRIEGFLDSRSVVFRGMKLGGSVYAILINDAVRRHASRLEAIAIDREVYFREAEADLLAAQKNHRRLSARIIKQGLARFPFFFRTLRSVKRAIVPPTKHQI